MNNGHHPDCSENDGCSSCSDAPVACESCREHDMDACDADCTTEPLWFASDVKAVA